jgi:hypothetical protein
MNVFEFVLSGNEMTIAVVVGAASRERALVLLKENYENFEEEYDYDNEDAITAYRDSIISNTTCTAEFVREIFSTEEL